MSEREYTEEEIVEAIYSFAASRMQEGATNGQIKQELIEQGLDDETAHAVISNLNAARHKAKSSAGVSNMVWGAIWCVGGIAITAVTYQMAQGGGSYVVAWGAIIFGAIQFIRGASQAAGA